MQLLEAHERRVEDRRAGAGDRRREAGRAEQLAEAFEATLGDPGDRGGDARSPAASTTIRAWTVSSWLICTALATIASRRSRGGAPGRIASGGSP